MHHKKGNKTLTKNTNYTEHLLYNMAISLIKHKRIKTTLVKAKALRSYIEKLVTLSRKSVNDTHVCSLLLKKLHSNIEAVRALRELSQSYVTRPGGYTRVLRMGHRFGDNAKIALIEFV